ncbi:hypothetical protein P9112_010771 [Eukaryota sp. TZLM1-RC]
MKFVALISGGKDSIFNIVKCIELGHELCCVASLVSADAVEVDSYTFQTVGGNVLSALADCMGVPFISKPLIGSSINTEMNYTTTGGDEVEDLFQLLSTVKDRYPDVEGVSAGALFSEYQRNRVNHVCARLGLSGLYPIWGTKQSLLVESMISHGMEIMLIKTASMGLKRKHVGQLLSDVLPHLLHLEEMGVNVAGEGGEYESLVLYCPGLFKKRLVVDNYDVVVHSECDFAPVVYLKVNRFHVEDV